MTVSCPTESEIFSRTNVTRRLPPFDQLSVAEPATIQDRRGDLGPQPRTFAIPAWSAAKRCRQRSSPIRCWPDRGPRLRSGRPRKSDRDPIASSPPLIAFPPECHRRGRDGAPYPAREKDNAPPFDSPAFRNRRSENHRRATRLDRSTQQTCARGAGDATRSPARPPPVGDRW